MQIGPYEVLGEIGRGGMGAVYHARDPRLGREVALKLLLKGNDLRAAQRFLREAESLARLRHPHIVAMHGVEEHEGQQVIVMEWVAGESLQARLDRGERLSSAEASALARPLAEALDHAHSQGVLHRDLKPSNVLLGDDGRVRLTDFGLAWRLGDAAVERLSVSGQLLGSPGYWSPEQARGTRDLLGPHTDVWGLGATIYACLTGLAPVRGRTMAELVVATTYQPVQPPSTLVPGVEPELERIVLRCLAKAPEDRYGSAAALVGDLVRFNAGETDAGGRGLPLALIAAALLVAAVVGALAGQVDRGTPSDPEAHLASHSPTPSGTPSATAAQAPALTAEAKAEATAWFERAQERLERADLPSAIAACDRALEANPRFARALALRGQLKANTGRRKAGRLDCEAAIALAPGSAQAHYALASVLELEGAQQPALERLRIALQQDADHFPSLLARGGLLLALGRVDEARVQLERAARVEPHVRQTRVLLGRLEVESGNHAEAEAHFTAALQQRAQDAWVLRARGLARRALKKAGAQRDLRAALELEPNHPEALFQLATLRAELGDHSDATRLFTRALEAAPRSCRSLLGRGKARLAGERYDEAAADVASIVKIDPNYLPAYVLQAEVLLGQRQHEAAGRALMRAFQINPNDTSARLTRARVYLELRRSNAAELDCDLVLHAHPDHPTALALRAQARFRQRRYREAAKDVRRYFEVAPKDDRARAQVRALAKTLAPHVR